MAVREIIGELLEVPDWERRKSVSIRCIEVNLELVYLSTTTAIAALWIYNFILWVAIPLSITDCSDTCKTVWLIVSVVYLLLAWLLVPVLYFIVQNTIWGYLAIPFALLFAFCSPFFAPLSVVVILGLLVLLVIMVIYMTLKTHITIGRNEEN